jgi:hypothetical protein
MCRRVGGSTWQCKSSPPPGLSETAKVADVLGSRHVHTLKEHEHRMVNHFEDDFRPWCFTKHWSGSFGFSCVQKELIEGYIHSRPQQPPAGLYALH